MLAMATFVGFAVLVTALIHLYLWKRLVRDTTSPGRSRRIGGLAALLLALLVPATMAGTRNGMYWLAWPGYLWLALMFYLLVLLLVLEVPMAVARLVLRRRALVAEPTAAAPEPALVGAAEPPAAGSLEPPAGPVADPPAAAVDLPDHDPARRLLLARGAAIFAGLTAAGITGYGVRTALGPPQLKRVRIPLAKLPRSIGRLCGSPLVSRHPPGPLSGAGAHRRIVDMINGLDADLVAVVGDLVDGSVAELGAAAAAAAGPAQPVRRFFVTGNHEYYSGVPRSGSTEVAGSACGRCATSGIELPGGLDLAGVNDVDRRRLRRRPDYAAALGGRDPAGRWCCWPTSRCRRTRRPQHGVDLQLSGHTHGGQMVPFNLVVRAAAAGGQRPRRGRRHAGLRHQRRRASGGRRSGSAPRPTSPWSSCAPRTAWPRSRHRCAGHAYAWRRARGAPGVTGCARASVQRRSPRGLAMGRRSAHPLEVLPGVQPRPRAGEPRLVGPAQGHRRCSAPATSPTRPGTTTCARTCVPAEPGLYRLAPERGGATSPAGCRPGWRRGDATRSGSCSAWRSPRSTSATTGPARCTT